MQDKNTGLDRSLPHIGVIMDKYDTDVYPRYTLPEGFYFSSYKDDLIRQWGELQLSVEMVDSITEAENYFVEDFLLGKGHDWLNPENFRTEKRVLEEYPYYAEMCRRVVFVMDIDGVLAGTGALWYGNIFGTKQQRLHWIAVKPEHQSRGISKAIITKLLDLYNELGYKGYIYLTSQTWSYRALNIYGKFGFKPYMGERPEKWLSVNLVSGNFEPWDYKEKNIEAWKLITNKIAQYCKE